MSDSGTRLNKYLASCGIGSRRACDALIQSANVIVNGQVEINPATRVTAEDFIKIDGKRVQVLQRETLLLNKPKGLVCSKNDELNRDTIYSLIPPKYQHLNHVGRLDKESEGLLVLTNDGELAQSLTHPSKKIEKEYIVTTDKAFENEILSKFLKGIYTPEGKAVAKSVKRMSPRRVRIVLETGLKRQIRMMFQAVNIRVKKLVRVRIGSLLGDGLEPGKIEVLEQERINLLFTAQPTDPRATTLQSQAEFRGQGKRKMPKKWSKPTSRSHDGKTASDRPKRKSTKRTTDRFSEDKESRPARKTSSNFSRSKKTTSSFSRKAPKKFSSPRKKR